MEFEDAGLQMSGKACFTACYFQMARAQDCTLRLSTCNSSRRESHRLARHRRDWNHWSRSRPGERNLQCDR
jgi:hypothetical protein